MRKVITYFVFVTLLVSGFLGAGNVFAASGESNGLKEKITEEKKEKRSFSEADKKIIEEQLKQKLSEDRSSIKTLADYLESEPNNDFTHANFLPMEDVVYGTFDVNDVDMYQIDINNPIELVVAGSSQQNIDLNFALADAFGEWIDPDYYDYYEGAQFQVYTIPEGIYYIKATDENGGGEDDIYALSAYNMEYIERISGDDRYETAIKIAEAGWPEGTDNAVLATGLTFPDALAGAPLAFQLNAPILLTPKTKLDSRVRDLLVDLDVKKVTILGGTSAISSEIENYLKNTMKLEVRRLSGATRYETATKIAENLLPTKQAVVAYGGNFPDALSIAPYAAMYGLPIFLTEKDELSSATKKALSSYNKTYVVGGPAAISEAVERQLPLATRLNGNDRYETSIEIAKTLNLPTSDVFMATGEGFADALSGSVLAALYGEPMILTKKNSLPTSTKQFLKEQNTSYYTILGGDSAVGIRVEEELFE